MNVSYFTQSRTTSDKSVFSWYGDEISNSQTKRHHRNMASIGSLTLFGEQDFVQPCVCSFAARAPAKMLMDHKVRREKNEIEDILFLRQYVRPPERSLCHGVS